MPNDDSQSGLFPDDMVAAQIDDEDEGEIETNTKSKTDESSETTDEQPKARTTSTMPQTAASSTTDESNETGSETGTDQETNSPTEIGGEEGFIEGGLTRDEAVAMIGMTIPCYALAAFVLYQMTNHGIHHAPIGLWAAFGVLVVVPVALLFGTTLAQRFLQTIMTARRKHE